MFSDSNINKLIASFEDLRKFSKKSTVTQTKAYSNLEQWAKENSNNNAIQDIGAKFAILFGTYEDDFKNFKLDALSNFTNVFRKFKEFDNQLKAEKKSRDELEKKEQKYYEKIKKCPSHKNIRDYEVKCANTKHKRQLTELRIFQLSKDIDTTKSILFKKNVQLLVQSLQQNNEAEHVLLEAMENLISQMPDVSSEEVDDINAIRYNKRGTTDAICMRAKHKLTSLSASSLRHVPPRQCAASRELCEQADASANIVRIQVTYSPELGKHYSNNGLVAQDEGGQQAGVYMPLSAPPTPPTTNAIQPPSYNTTDVWSSGSSCETSPSIPSAPSFEEANDIMPDDATTGHCVSKKALAFIH